MEKERVYKICTGCGAQLPRNRNLWGLVWASNKDHGMCKQCLWKLRTAFGVYVKHPELEKADKPK